MPFVSGSATNSFKIVDFMNGEIVIQEVLQGALGTTFDDLFREEILSPSEFQQNRPYLTEIIDVLA